MRFNKAADHLDRFFTLKSQIRKKFLEIRYFVRTVFNGHRPSFNQKILLFHWTSSLIEI